MSGELGLAKEKAIWLLKGSRQDDAEFTGRINRLQSQKQVVDEINRHFRGGQQPVPYHASVLTVRFDDACFYPIALAMLFLSQPPMRYRFHLVFDVPNIESVSNEDVDMLCLAVRYFPIVSVEFFEIPLCLAVKLPEIFSVASQTITSLYLYYVSVEVLKCVTDLVEEGKFPKLDSIMYYTFQGTVPDGSAGQFVRLLSARGLRLIHLQLARAISSTDAPFFTPEEFVSVMDAIKQHQRSLKRLCLTGGVQPVALPCILEAVNGLFEIDTVDLSRNHSLVDDDAESIIREIRGHRSVKYFDLYDTQITDAKQKEVARLVKVSSQLRSRILVALMSALSIPRLRARSPLRVLSVELVRRLGLFLGDEDEDDDEDEDEDEDDEDEDEDDEDEDEDEDDEDEDEDDEDEG